MNEALLKLWIGAQFKLKNFWDDFKSEENGAAALVTTALIIVVVVVLLAIFRDRLTTFINNIFDNLDSAPDQMKSFS